MIVALMLANAAPELWQRHCAECHDDARIAPMIETMAYPPSALGAIVRNGVNMMPAFTPREISDAEIETLGQWLKAKREAR